MKVAIGADHGGFRLKKVLITFLKTKGYKVKDFGTFSEESCDYPLIGYRLSKSVASGRYTRGILICRTGIGMCMVANKVKGVRAAVCGSVKIARSSREHNDANVLILAADIISDSRAKKIVDVWLKTSALGGRHKRRVSQIKKIERLLT